MTATASTSRVQRPDVPKPNQYQRQQPKAARALTYRASDKDKDHWATSISRNAPIHAKPTGQSPQVQQRTSTTDTLARPVLSLLQINHDNERPLAVAGFRGTRGVASLGCRSIREKAWRAAPAASVAGRAWWAREDLNFRPHAYQARALTS